MWLQGHEHLGSVVLLGRLGFLALGADVWAAQLGFPLDIWKTPFEMDFSWGWPSSGGCRGCEFGSWPGVVNG